MNCSRNWKSDSRRRCVATEQAATRRSPGELEVLDLRLEAGAENFRIQRVFEGKLDEECPYQVVLPRQQLTDDSEILDFLLAHCMSRTITPLSCAIAL